MVASISRLIIRENELEAFVSHCEKVVLPRYQNATGILFVWLWHRPCIAYADVQIVSIWRSREAIDQFFAANPFTEIKHFQEGVILPEDASACYQVLSWGIASGMPPA
ncbi:MAG TPA: hypothetical protein VFR08_11725 [Candidatus Angelobacter sp.]|nr:hypothetical protein [Candidatus Angelobacter sp.]